MKNKRGEALVEASLVLPLVILVIISLLTLMIFFYSSFRNQVDLHRELLNMTEMEKSSVRTIEKNIETKTEMKGITGILMQKNFKSSIKAYREAEIIRAGEIIYE